ncbi:hypothetical protein GJAV_G00171670 [Gymnothorax javanicus]|nr:hypothetical protein GJAV_G00171670 [Gymnothorax javanicus]
MANLTVTSDRQLFLITYAPSVVLQQFIRTAHVPYPKRASGVAVSIDVRRSAKMIKLQALNAYFTDRLMAAVQEIMKVVGDTLFEYQDETERTKRENEILRMRLRDVGLDAEVDSPHRSLTEQLELSSESAGQDTTFTQPAVKVEFTEPRKNKLEEEENRVLEVSCGGSVVQAVFSEYDQDSVNQPAFPSRDSKPESRNCLDLKPQSGIIVEEELVPSDSQYPFKPETDEDDRTRSGRPVNLLICELNPAGQSVKPGNGGQTNESINNRPKLLSIVQNSSENSSELQGESSLSCVYCGKEIMQVVEGTLMEYQEETDRTKRENEILRRRLLRAGTDSETTIPKPVPPLSVDRAVAEFRHTQSAGPAVKMEITEQQRNSSEGEEECQAESGSSGAAVPSPKRERDQDSQNQPAFTPPVEKRDAERNSPELQIGIPEQTERVPSLAHCQVKTEADEADCNISGPPIRHKLHPGSETCHSANPAELLFIDALNPAGQTLQSENGEVAHKDMGSRSAMFAEQHSGENSNTLSGEGSLSCVYCGKAFFLLSRLKTHLRSHTADSSYRCSVCGKSFSQAGNLTVHMRVHTGKKPYSCNICGKSFNYSGKFKEHKRIHTGERPYRCSFCGKFFSQSGHLKAHVRIHTGEKPYRCPVCGTCFAQLSQIKRHLLTHTREISLDNYSVGGELHYPMAS